MFVRLCCVHSSKMKWRMKMQSAREWATARVKCERSENNERTETGFCMKRA
jgi:hypothetical protein